jgi:hypothetical protein
MKRYSILGFLLICLLVTGLASAAQRGGRWELLGRQEVDFRRDHDRIEVGRHEGRFKQLQIRVQGGSIEMNKMVVTFDNDERFSPQLRRRFEEGSESHVIDLPGNRRAIKSIDFNYHSIKKREGKGTVAVYGR